MLSQVAVRESFVGRPVLGRVVLVSGPETLLAERAVAELLNASRAEAPEADRHDVEAAGLDAGRLTELTGGSLLAAAAAVVVRDIGALPAEVHPALLALVAAPEPECALVLVHVGGNKGKGLVDKIRKAGVEVVDCPTPKAWEVPQFVRAEVRRHRASMEPPAEALLVAAVGHDLRALAAAVEQLVADSERPELSEQLVRRYFGGRAEVSGFAITDAALAGHTDRAMQELRWALSIGVSPVLVSSALAAGLRGLGRLTAHVAPGARDADVAREVGVPAWKLKSMRQQLRGWDAAGLAGAITIAARADADVKGAAEDPDHALESAVLAITRCRQAR